MIGTWLRDTERIKLATVGQGARVVGIVSPMPGAGASTLARELAEVSALSGKRTILVDLTQRIASTPTELGWRPAMTLVDGRYPASLVGVRALRADISKALGALQLTRGHERDAALAVCEVATHIVKEPRSSATRLDVRMCLERDRIIVELTHDGVPVLTDSALAATRAPVPIAAEDPALGLALARELLSWSIRRETDRQVTLTASRFLPANAPSTTLAEPFKRIPPAAFDELTAAPDASTKLLFNNVDLMRAMLHSELAAYEAVVVDLPPLLDDAADRLNPLAAAAACDALLLLCVSGLIDSAALARSMEIFKRAGISVTGLVLNDVSNPTLGEEMAREARRLERLLPTLSRWLSGKALRSRFLSRASS